MRNPECIGLPLGTEKEDSFYQPNSAPLCDLLDEVVEKIEIDWPEFRPVERIGAGIMEIALGLLLSARLVALGIVRRN